MNEWMEMDREIDNFCLCGVFNYVVRIKLDNVRDFDVQSTRGNARVMKCHTKNALAKCEFDAKQQQQQRKKKVDSNRFDQCQKSFSQSR